MYIVLVNTHDSPIVFVCIAIVDASVIFFIQFIEIFCGKYTHTHTKADNGNAVELRIFNTILIWSMLFDPAHTKNRFECRIGLDYMRKKGQGKKSNENNNNKNIIIRMFTRIDFAK